MTRGSARGASITHAFELRSGTVSGHLIELTPSKREFNPSRLHLRQGDESSSSISHIQTGLEVQDWRRDAQETQPQRVQPDSLINEIVLAGYTARLCRPQGAKCSEDVIAHPWNAANAGKVPYCEPRLLL